MKFSGKKGTFKTFFTIFNNYEISKRITYKLTVHTPLYNTDIEFKSIDKSDISDDDKKEIEKIINIHFKSL
ncbi:hypothetical protein GSF70_11515 [Flavobacteriaceae bacterium W22]|nr:hypothetical protein [Flavobacteriaceae bacterium W22]